MAVGDQYPGFTGVLGIGETTPLSKNEQDAFRVDISDLIELANDPDSFFNELVECVQRLRNLLKLDRDRTTAARRDNLDAVESAWQRGAKVLALSQINRGHFNRLRERHPESSASELLQKVREAIPSARRGRAPNDALRYGAARLAEVYRQHMPQLPSSRTEGPFCQLLAAVSRAADGRLRTDLHSAAEEGLKLRAVEESPGVSSIARGCFSR